MAEAWDAVFGPAGQHLRQPHAKLLYARLDLDQVLGWAPYREKLPANYRAFLQHKAQYPDKLIAMRVSGCFWFVGIDAVVVCEKLGVKGERIATRCEPDDRPSA